MIYLWSFAISCLLIGIAEKSKSKYIFIFLSLIALLIPCLLAGFRAETIGTDVRVYVKPMYEAAINADKLTDYFQSRWYLNWTYAYVYEYEIGFALLVYCVSKIFGSLSAVLFFIEAIIIVPVYIGLVYFKKQQPIWLGMLVFFLMDYNVSLNMMRQWIAMSILFMGLRYLFERDRWRYFLTILVAMLFHSSAILGIAIYFIYSYLYDEKKVKFIKINNVYIKGQTVRMIIVIMIGFILLISLNMIIPLLSILGLSRYIGYIRGNLHFLPNQLFLRLPVLLLILMMWKKSCKNNTTIHFYVTMIFLDLLSSQLASITVNSGRISAYFALYNILSYPSIYFQTSKKRIIRYLGIIMLIIYLIVYWLYFFNILGSHQTIPYISSL